MCADPSTLNDLLWFVCYLTTGKHLGFYVSFGTVLLLLAVTAPAALALGFGGAMLARSRSRGTLLPVLLYPMTVPVIIGGVRGTAALLQADPDLAMARSWLVLLLCFDTVFITLALWLFEPVMTE